MSEQITAGLLATRLINDEITLIDVREKEEFEEAHIPGAQLIPLSTFKPELITSQKPVVIYCRSGGRSSRACQLLKTFKPSLEVYNLQGGILDWMQQGFNVNS